MTKRKTTKQNVDELGHKCLSLQDQLAMVTADAEAAVAAAEADRDLARYQVLQLQAEKSVTASRDKANTARIQRRALAEDIARRYAIDWQTHALEPLTGRLVPLNEDMNHGS